MIRSKGSEEAGHHRVVGHGWVDDGGAEQVPHLENMGDDNAVEDIGVGEAVEAEGWRPRRVPKLDRSTMDI
jgi:hypothetical protein